MVQGAANSNANKGGILGFFGTLFSGSKSSSPGYYRPPTSAPGTEVVICQPIEGVACQPMQTVVCQPVEGVACQPMTMVQGPLPGQ